MHFSPIDKNFLVKVYDIIQLVLENTMKIMRVHNNQYRNLSFILMSSQKSVSNVSSSMKIPWAVYTTQYDFCIPVTPI